MPTHYFASIPELAPLFENSDYTDIKSINTPKTLREFLPGFIYHAPQWLCFIYKIRAVFIRFLGMRQENVDLTPIYFEKQFPDPKKRLPLGNLFTMRT